MPEKRAGCELNCDTACIPLVQWGHNSTGELWLVYLRNDRTAAVATFGGGVCNSTALNDGAWHNVIAVLPEGKNQSTDLLLYVDGQLNTTAYAGTCTIDTHSENVPVHIGAYCLYNEGYPAYAYTQATIDDVRIYSRALNETEIQGIAKLPNPVAHWKLNKNAFDATAHQYHATNGGDPNTKELNWSNAGYLNQSLSGDPNCRVNGYKGILGAHARTTSAWIKTSSYGPLLYWGDPASQHWLMGINSSGYVYIQIQTSNGTKTGQTLVNNNQWHHIVAVFPEDGTPNCSDIKIFIDSTEDSCSQSNLALNTAEGDDVVLGGAPFGADFTGMIDDVRIYDQALTSSQISVLRSGTKSQEPIAYWNFGQGTVADANDCSGNAHNGTVYGNVVWDKGLYSGALEVQGNSGYMQVPSHSDFDFAGAFTLSVWVKADKDISRDGRVVYRFDPNSNDAYFLSYGTTGWRFYVRNNGSWADVNSNAAPKKGAWTHLVGRRSQSGLLELFVDGVKQTDTDTKTGLLSSGVILLGKDYYNNPVYEFTGTIDEVKIYN
jgi:hypothetical protein